ncbi:unnamed protein product [Nezara viridula]|uniref:Uncharacterized protein n=1 Tax=Nezara viridula TaxID=85310 RepID=A0A9P0EB38_NEZVI|nr:unnamed protein product [Nezara viridula]
MVLFKEFEGDWGLNLEAKFELNPPEQHQQVVTEEEVEEMDEMDEMDEMEEMVESDEQEEMEDPLQIDGQNAPVDSDDEEMVILDGQVPEGFGNPGTHRYQIPDYIVQCQVQQEDQEEPVYHQILFHSPEIVVENNGTQVEAFIVPSPLANEYCTLQPEQVGTISQVNTARNEGYMFLLPPNDPNLPQQPGPSASIVIRHDQTIIGPPNVRFGPLRSIQAAPSDDESENSSGNLQDDEVSGSVKIVDEDAEKAADSENDLSTLSDASEAGDKLEEDPSGNEEAISANLTSEQKSDVDQEKEEDKEEEKEEDKEEEKEEEEKEE